MSIITTVRRFTEANPGKTTLLAPVFYAAHIMEEVPGYVSWFNSIVPRGLSQDDFLPSNVLPFAITALLATVVAYTERRIPTLIMLVWIANYMFANAIYHVTATLVLMRYGPGTVTAIVLYLPYFIWFVNRLRTHFRVPPLLLAGLTLLGGLPWFIQGFLVVFKGERF